MKRLAPPKNNNSLTCRQLSFSTVKEIVKTNRTIPNDSWGWWIRQKMIVFRENIDILNSCQESKLSRKLTFPNSKHDVDKSVEHSRKDFVIKVNTSAAWVWIKMVKSLSLPMKTSTDKDFNNIAFSQALNLNKREEETSKHAPLT